ncbi:hypothetical protein [Salipiger sp. PrR003]|uniref:hypothetical protein n=1 Tax=Salipiger sp. PrR003 TaxID=2706776 RepID=UPI0013DAFF52|nr:hypothetical protein [Salipiger sp. PrR003]NDV50626.1 hypothetical protein [Salipiger sp. PrR003]
MRELIIVGMFLFVVALLGAVSVGLWMAIPYLNVEYSEAITGVKENTFSFMQNSVGIASTLVLGATALVVAWRSVQLSKTQTMLTTMDLSSAPMAALRKDLVECEMQLRELVEASVRHATATAKYYSALVRHRKDDLKKAYNRALTPEEVIAALAEEDRQDQATLPINALRATTEEVEAAREELRLKMLSLSEWASSPDRGVLFHDAIVLASDSGMSRELDAVYGALATIERDRPLEYLTERVKSFRGSGAVQKLMRISHELKKPGALVSVFHGDCLGEEDNAFYYADPMIGMTSWERTARRYMDMGAAQSPAVHGPLIYPDPDTSKVDALYVPLSEGTFYVGMDVGPKAVIKSSALQGLDRSVSKGLSDDFLSYYATERAEAPSFRLLRGITAAKEKGVIERTLFEFYRKMGVDRRTARSLTKSFMVSLPDSLYKLEPQTSKG